MARQPASTRLPSMAALLAVIFAFLLLPLSASAHARQVRTNPPPGALLDASPPYIQIEWSESVNLNFSSVQVYNRERTEQTVGALGQPASQNTVIKASLPKPLPPGTYTVVWRVVSATDGHVTAGSFAFRIKGGASDDDDTPIAPDSTLAGERDSEDAGPLRWLVRAVILAGATFLLGGALFTIGVAGPTAGECGDMGARLRARLRQGFARLGAMSAALVAMALLLDLVAQVMAIERIGFLDALGSSDQAWALISTTRYGLGWLLKIGGAGALLVIMLFVWLRQAGKPLRIGPTPWDLAVAASALLLLGEAISSHAAAFHEADTHDVAGHTTSHAPGLPLPVLSDWVHLTSVSLWLGGLGYMALVLFPGFRLADFTIGDRRAFLRRAVPRFSRLAIVSVALLAFTGTYNLLLHSSDLNTILATSYGQVVAVKVAAFIVLVGIGATNLLRLLMDEGRKPKDESGSIQNPKSKIQNQTTSSADGFQRRVRWEVALSVVALVCAGGLTLLPPPVDATADGSGQASTPVTAVTSTAGYRMSLTVKPSLAGDEITLDVVGETAASLPLTDVLKALFRVTPLAVDAGSAAYTAALVQPSPPGSYAWRIKEPALTVNGAYLITCIIERTESADLRAAFRLDLTESGLRMQPTAVPTPGP